MTVECNTIKAFYARAKEEARLKLSAHRVAPVLLQMNIPCELSIQFAPGEADEAVSWISHHGDRVAVSGDSDLAFICNGTYADARTTSDHRGYRVWI